MARSKEVIPWTIFAAGGSVSAIVIPAMILAVLAAATGYADGFTYERLKSLLGHPVTKLMLIGVFFVTFFHCAHRLKFTIPSLLRIHAKAPFAVLFYLGAIAATAFSAMVLWRI